jgi:TolB-like protein
MPDIFLSYTREDQATAQRFAEAFEAQGFSVWWDVTLRSGEAYDQVTEEALRTAKAVVVLWSQKSVISRWVRAEATLADRNRTLVPAAIEPCERPIMFELTQTANLCRWTGDRHDPAWRAFVTDVRRFVEAGAAPPTHPVTRPSVQATPTPPKSTRPSLAVLPFINRSGREEDDSFADGMVEDLIAALAGSQWMKVVAASATAIYRKGARDLRQIGRDLGVRYLLEGNVRRVGAGLRVAAQLVEAENSNILWTQKFDRPLAELSALQEDLATEVAAHLGAQVQRVEMEHALKKPGDLSAWEAFLRATARPGRTTRDLEAVLAETKRAVEIDPNDGLPYALLAATQGRLLMFRGGDDPELTQEIVENIRRARALDPDNPFVLVPIVIGLIGLGKLRDALPLAERAVALSPNFDAAHHVLGAVLLRLGRSDEVLAEVDATERLAPNRFVLFHSSINRSVAHLQAGRIDEALEAADRADRLLPGPESLTQSMLCLAKSKRWDLASDALHRLRDADPEMSRAGIENIVRDFHCGSKAVDEYVAIARKLWGEMSNEPRSS